jgi:hypothetical protein
MPEDGLTKALQLQKLNTFTKQLELVDIKEVLEDVTGEDPGVTTLTTTPNYETSITAKS